CRNGRHSPHHLSLMLLYYIYPSEVKYFMLEKGISDTFVADDHSSPAYRWASPCTRLKWAYPCRV
ncbi:hypothetical protein, partial [Enterococcus lemanii]